MKATSYFSQRWMWICVFFVVKLLFLSDVEPHDPQHLGSLTWEVRSFMAWSSQEEDPSKRFWEETKKSGGTVELLRGEQQHTRRGVSPGHPTLLIGTRTYLRESQSRCKQFKSNVKFNASPATGKMGGVVNCNSGEGSRMRIVFVEKSSFLRKQSEGKEGHWLEKLLPDR